MKNLAYNVGVNQSIQKTYTIGGRGYVAVDLANMPYEFVPLGGKIVNTIAAGEVFSEGDICEFDPKTQSVKVMRTFTVAKAVGASDTELLLLRDDEMVKNRHIPSNGINVMKSPSTLTTTGTGVTLGVATPEVETISGKAVKVWKITIAANALGTLAVGDILVEADKAGTGAKMFVKNPNSFVFSDIVFNYPSINGTDTFSGSIVTYAPILHYVYWVERMNAIPACVKAINKSRIDGWFEL